MILEKIKVAVETSTNVKFIASIPVTVTIREILPILLKAYHAVVHENYEEEEAAGLLHANRIKSITKNGYLIPLAEEVLHVLNDSDTLFLHIGKQEKKETEHQNSKKEKLEIKKEDKKLEKIMEKILEEHKAAQQDSEKKQPKPVVEKEQKSVQVKKVTAKKQDSKEHESKSNISNAGIDKLLQKIREKPAAQAPPAVAAKQKKYIVQAPSESDDSDE